MRYWTTHRFAPEVIRASDLALDRLKTLFGAQRLVLVGYSGGAAVALLVAARRHDMGQIITVAGNLDHQAWTHYHHVQALSGSLNPVDNHRSTVDCCIGCALKTALSRPVSDMFAMLAFFCRSTDLTGSSFFMEQHKWPLYKSNF